MTWTTSNRRSRLPKDWPVRVRTVLGRDGHRCQVRLHDKVICGKPANEVDHIIPGDDHKLSNLRAICSFHHSRKSSAEGHRAYAETMKRNRARFSRSEVHPA